MQLLQLSQRLHHPAQEGQAVPATIATPPQHHWPHARGAVPGQHSITAHKAPRDLARHLAWSWHHPMGRYYTTVAGSSSMDSKGNIYLATNEAVRKFDRDGNVLWTYAPPGLGDMNNQPALMGDHVYGNTKDAVAFCLDIETGTPVWEKKQARVAGGDVGYPGAFDGLFLMGIHAGVYQNAGNWDVAALDGATGERLWTYHSDMILWNFTPLFPGDDTVVFMDEAGGMYRLGLHNGSLIWKHPPGANLLSFTDGGAIISPDSSAVYSCSNFGNYTGQEGQPGILRAYELNTGAPLWERVLPQPCNTWPVVGDLGADSLSVLVPVGGFLNAPTSSTPPEGTHRGGMMVFDAASGVLQYKWQAPLYHRDDARGDSEGLYTRMHTDKLHPVCLPAQWSAPTLAGDGAVYTGRADGFLYVLRPPPRSRFEAVAIDEPLPVDFASTPEVDVTRFDLGSAFLHGGTSWAPGMMSIATCDTLFAFRFPE